MRASDIHREVMASFAELEADPAYTHAVEGISAQWQFRHEKKHLSVESFQPRQQTLPASNTCVDISCGKSHSTIWGNTVNSLNDIPSSEARRVFQSIMEVPGLTRILLTAFGHKGERSSCGALVHVSKTPFVIEGNLFDKGEKGTMQTFQVRVQADTQKKRIFDDIISKLKEKEIWAG